MKYNGIDSSNQQTAELLANIETMIDQAGLEKTLQALAAVLGRRHNEALHGRAKVATIVYDKALNCIGRALRLIDETYWNFGIRK